MEWIETNGVVLRYDLSGTGRVPLSTLCCPSCKKPSDRLASIRYPLECRMPHDIKVDNR